MKAKYLLLVLLISLTSVSFTGCFGVSEEFCSIREAVLEGMNKNEKFEDIFIINLEKTELVMVEAHGDLDKVVELAIRDKDLNLDPGDIF